MGDSSKRQRVESCGSSPDPLLLLPADIDEWLSSADGSQTPAVLDLFHQVMDEQKAQNLLGLMDDSTRQLPMKMNATEGYSYSGGSPSTSDEMVAQSPLVGHVNSVDGEPIPEENPWATTRFASMKLYQTIDAKGSVWKGSWKGRAVAAKVLSINMETDSNELRRFTKQVAYRQPDQTPPLFSRLSTKHVCVAGYDSEQTQSCQYLHLLRELHALWLSDNGA